MDLKDYITSKLNEEQAKATLHTDTDSLIIAGAGSGKTRVLTYKIAYLFRGVKIPISRVLAVTFTNKAANEMKERLIQISEEMSGIVETSLGSNSQLIQGSGDDLSDFLSAMEQSKPTSSSDFSLSASSLKWIGTFHSIFLKILKEDIDKLQMKYNKNFGIIDDATAVIREILKRLNLTETFKPKEVQGFISRQKNNGVLPADFLKGVSGDYDATMGKVYEEYQKSLEIQNSLDFDDLLLLPYILFQKSQPTLQKWQNHFDYILVDEAQDTNWIQFELMRLFTGGGANITMIGDDYQSIYGWRGALMENFLNLKSYRPKIKMFKLQTNYRSKPHIVQAGNAIIKNNKNQYEKDVIAHRSGEDKITIFSHNTDTDEAATTLGLIKKMKNSGKLTSRGQVAILYRTNSQSSIFETLCLQEGIPYKIRGAFKFFDRKEIKDILAYVRRFLNPQDNIALKRIINTPNRKVGDTTFEKISEYALSHSIPIYETISSLRKGESPLENLKITPQAMTGIKLFILTMEDLRIAVETLTPSAFLSLLTKKINYRDHLIKEEGSEELAQERYDNIGQLVNMAEKYPETGEEALRQFMEEVALLADVVADDQGEIDAVKLMTAHSSKGLEFPMVFVVGLEDGMFPLSNASLDPKTLEEERRLMYVAITRAKDILFLSSAQSRMTRGQTKNNPPSRFISELPTDLVKLYDLSGGLEKESGPVINEGDTVKHKLFGTGYVFELRNNMAVVKFHNPKFGLRKVEKRFLEVV
ncbi:DNA helicase [candidate division SR1 bacterium]|nr:DNA helicase [candidate division SR1 bacterium]